MLASFQHINNVDCVLVCINLSQQVYEEQAKQLGEWKIPPIVEEMKSKAMEADLWNLFLPGVSGLSQLAYAPMAEEMGRSPLAPEVFNCSAPGMEYVSCMATVELWLL